MPETQKKKSLVRAKRNVLAMRWRFLEKTISISGQIIAPKKLFG
jgi:hypothetical protein